MGGNNHNLFRIALLSFARNDKYSCSKNEFTNLAKIREQKESVELQYMILGESDTAQNEKKS